MCTEVPITCLLFRVSLALPLLAIVSASWYEARPPDQTPVPKLPPGGQEAWLPKPYLGSTVTGLMLSFDASAVRNYDEADKDQVKVDIEGQGPVLFSVPRWNQGDFAPRLQPLRPYAQPNLGRIMPGRVGSRFESPVDIPAQAWRPSIQKGVMLGTVAQNGQKWNDTAPLFYGTVACVYASHGFGYGMDEGEFSNRNPNINIAIGKLGEMLEANIDVAIAWFPYYEGWLAGYVDTPGVYSKEKAKSSWTAKWSSSPFLSSDAAQTVSWDEEGALLTLPGVDARYDGMIFLTSTNPGPGNNDGNVVSSFIDGDSWRVQVREDDQPNPELFCLPDQAMFAFVYVPYSAGGLIGGHMDGATGMGEWRGGVVTSRVSVGVYHLQIYRPGLDRFNAVQPLSNRDGMLLLQVVDQEFSLPRFSRHCVLSYSILPNGTIEVQSRKLHKAPQHAESYPAVDTNFYFAWVDFRTPLTPTADMYTGSIPSFPDHAAMDDPSFWDGLVLGVCLASAFVLILGTLFVGATRFSERSSYLALAPIQAPFSSPLGTLSSEDQGDPAADGHGHERGSEGQRVKGVDSNGQKEKLQGGAREPLLGGTQAHEGEGTRLDVTG